VDRCALFVDAGYVLADGAMAVHGTRHRESVSWNYPGLLQFLGTVAGDRTGLPLLRCYWYEATVEGRRSSEHDALADLPGVKLRLGRMRPGRREGVESEIHRDLTTLARNGAIRDALVVSAEEDLAQVIADVQDLGLRVTLVHITVDGNWTISRALRQECDDIVEIGEAHLRPYVELVVGAEPLRDDDRQAAGSHSGRALTNGHRPVGPLGPQPALPVGSNAAPPEIYTAPVIAEYQRTAQAPMNGQPGSPQPANLSGPIGQAPAGPQALPPGQPQPAAPAPAGGGQQGTVVMPDMQPSSGMAAQPGMAAAQQAMPPAQRVMPPAAQQAMPTAQLAAAPGQPVQTSGPISAPQAMPQPAAAPGMAGQPGPQPSAPPAQQQPQNSGVMQAPAAMAPGPPAPAAPRQPMPPGPVGQQPAAGQPGMPPQQAGMPPQQAGMPPPQAGMQPPPTALQPPQAQPGHPGMAQQQAGPPGAPGVQPGEALYSAPPAYQGPPADVPAGPGGPGGGPGRRRQGGPRQAAGGPQPAPALAALPGPGTGQPGPSGPGQAPGAGGQGMPGGQNMPGPANMPGGPGMPGAVGPAALPAQQARGAVRSYPATASTGRYARGQQGQQYAGPPADQSEGGPAVGYVPQPQMPYGGPQPGAPHQLVPQQASVSLADAVQAAHGEGFNFGQAVASEAPALWLEAVLARKPRMPSDLEARLLQDSALPIDSLLHDEVRHALRRGFWDALERARH
jgi:hypothetical protein